MSSVVDSTTKTRIYLVDYLRAAIVSLVFLHHIAITYGANGSWYYTEPATDQTAAGLLSLFTNFNQAWFMGLFFLLSGYFTPSSFDHKGLGQFLRDRLIRLGIPLLFFFFLLSPLTIFIAASHTTAAVLAQEHISLPLAFTGQFYLSHLGTGPLWFVELLLIFDFGYAAWRLAGGKAPVRHPQSRPFPTYRQIGVFILLFAAANYLFRIVVPIGPTILGFPSLFDLPQYTSFFIIGAVAARGDWLRKMPGSVAKRVFGIAIIATLTVFPLAIVGTDTPSLGWGSVYGYGSLASAFYALWDSTFAVGTSMLLIDFFRRYFALPGKLWKYAAQNFYAAYILQAPIIVTVSAVMLSSVHAGSLLKFIVASAIAVPLTWGAAGLVRRIPFASRVV